MSSDLVSSVIELHRTDAAEVVRVLRPYLVAGGMATAIIDFGDRKLYLERTKEAHKQAMIRKEQQDLSKFTDPVPVLLENDLIEMDVRGLTLKEIMFECLNLAARSDAAVSHWACGSMKIFTELGNFKRPLLSKELSVAGARVVESTEQLRPGDLVACLAASQDALSMEVERGLLIRLEDLRHVEADGHTDRLRGYSEGGPDLDEEPGADLGGASTPTWFGPSPS